MFKQNIILDKIYSFFINSNDFNGISLSQLSQETQINYLETVEVLKNLVKENKISVQTGENPHIIRLEHYKLEKQLEILDEAKDNKEEIFTSFENIVFMTSTHLVCVYPSNYYLLKNRGENINSKPYYSTELSMGKPQLEARFFEIEVLEKYFKDPRYSFNFKDYSGQISCEYDENAESLIKKEDDKIFLETFGLGVDESEDRLVVVYLRYLNRLSKEHQIYWKSKEAINKKCQILYEYHANTIEGRWVFSHSIFSALIEEQRILNELSKSISTTSLFNKTFENDKRPKEFTLLFFPTLKNYHDFISLLDKMLSDNINKKFFKGKLDLYELIDLSDGVKERRNKGTIRLLEEWLKSSYNVSDENLFKPIFDPIKKVRKERQKPAHKISENVYDKKLIVTQRELMKEVFFSIQMLREIFQKNPAVSEIEIPKWLKNGKVKIF